MSRYSQKDIKHLLRQASFVKPADFEAIKNAINNIEINLSNFERIIPHEVLDAIDEIYQENAELKNKIAQLENENKALQEKIVVSLGTNECGQSTSLGKIVLGISDLEKKNEEAVFDALSAFHKKCPYCGKDHYRVGLRDKIEIDHFIPVSRGGQNLPWNLLPVCKECNRRKKDKLPFEFLEASIFERCQRYLLDVRRQHYEDGVQQMENGRKLAVLFKDNQHFLEKNAFEPFVQELLQIFQPEKLFEFKENFRNNNGVISNKSTSSNSIEFVNDYIPHRKGDFAGGVVMGPFHRVCDNIQHEAPAGIGRITPAIVKLVLKNLGWKDMGRLGSADFPTKKHIFCAPDIGRISKSDLRRMGETKI